MVAIQNAYAIPDAVWDRLFHAQEVTGSSPVPPTKLDKIENFYAEV